MRKLDIIGGVLIATLGVLLLVWLIPNYVEEDEDLRLPVSVAPTVVAIALLTAGCFLAIVAWLKKDEGESAATLFPQRELLGISYVVGTVALSTFAMQYVPFVVVMPVTLLMLMIYYGAFTPVRFLLTATIGPGLVYLVVYQLFERVLP